MWGGEADQWPARTVGRGRWNSPYLASRGAARQEAPQVEAAAAAAAAMAGLSETGTVVRAWSAAAATPTCGEARVHGVLSREAGAPEGA